MEYLKLLELRAEIITKDRASNPTKYVLPAGREDPAYTAAYEKVRRLCNDGAKNIRIFVIAEYKATMKAPHDITPIEQSQEIPESQSSVTSSTKKRSRAETATSRQLASANRRRVTDALTGDNAAAIFERWTCHNRYCQNHSRACYVAPGSSQHYKLKTDDIDRWSESINDEKTTTTIEAPPKHVFFSLLAQRNKE